MAKRPTKKVRNAVRAHRQSERRSKKRTETIRTALFIFLTIFAVLLVYSVFVEPQKITVTELEVPVDNLPWAFDGTRIVQLSDIHVNLWMRPHRLRTIVSRANALNPDVIVLTGDYVSRSVRYCEPAGRALSGLKAPLGAYAVLGNHEYWTDAARMTNALRKAGVDVLINEKRMLTQGNRRLWVVGLDDLWGGKPDYEKAFHGIANNEACIALAHNPDAVTSIRKYPADLVIAGHTHGGLIDLPLFGPLIVPTDLGKRYASGLFQFGSTQMFVSRGLGSGEGSHIRFRCPPEIAVLTLRRAQ